MWCRDRGTGCGAGMGLLTLWFRDGVLGCDTEMGVLGCGTGMGYWGMV